MSNKKLLILGVLAIILVSCGQLPQETAQCEPAFTQVSHTFLMTATNREMNAVMRQIGTYGTTCKINEVVYTQVIYNDEELVLFRTGVGPEAAKISMNITVDKFAKPKKMIFSGIAGGLDPSLSSGQTVVVTNWHPLENYNEVVAVDAELLKLIKPSYITANGVTSDHFVSNGNEVYALTQATIVDMETYYIAKIASENGIPFIAFRSVSDMANGTKDKSKFQIAADNSARAAIEFISTLTP